MFNTHLLKTLPFLLGASLFMAGCSSNMDKNNSTIGTGSYVDAEVEGVNYLCGTQSGKTDVSGKFQFEKGEDCTFELGGLILRKVSASDLGDNTVIFEDNESVAQLLQSCDMDGNADNGITIDEEIASIISESNLTTIPTDEIVINNLVKDIKTKSTSFKGRFVSKEEASLHANQTKLRYYLAKEDNNDMGTDKMSNMGSMGEMADMSKMNFGKMSGMDGMDFEDMMQDMGDMGDMEDMSQMDFMKVTSTTLADFNYTKFSKPLAIPALASYTTDANGTKLFNLDINASTTEFFDGVQTVTYGVNAGILGQTIRIHNGDKVKLTYNNNLDEPTTMHGHGMHLPAIMDGGPINDIQPGTSWSAEYTLNQTAATNWYHPHLMGKTAEQVYMGLAGFIIIDDDVSDALNLPKEYGVDDIPLALQDKRFDADGQIDYSPSTMEQRMGYKADVMLANGVINPYVDVPNKKVRFRVMNGSNARVYNLKFDDNRSFKQIATDNGFLEAPVSMNSLSLTPGERAEIIVDFTDESNTSVKLVDNNSDLEIMQINVNIAATTTSEVPTSLTTLAKLDPASAVKTRTFVYNMAPGDDGMMHMAINGKLMDIKRIDEVVPVDSVEIWEITNLMGMTHNFHIHGTHFYPIERDGSADNVAENEKGYKDTIALPPRSTVKVIVKMTDYTDADTGYMYHCHFLEHEDDGMMGQFSVVN